MSAVELPPIDVLRRRAAARVDALRPVIAGGAALVAIDVRGALRFALEAADDGVELAGRSLVAAVLPAVLAWRARQAAGLGSEHDVVIAAGRAVLAVPRGALEAVVGAARRDARALLDGTADALAVDVASRELPANALEAGGEGGFVGALDALIGRGLEEARLRRAEDAPAELWTPEAPAPASLGALGEQLRTTEGRVAAIGIAASSAAGAWAPLGIAIAAGASIAAVAADLEGLGGAAGSSGGAPEREPVPRLLLRIDGLEPDAAAGPGDEVAELPLGGVWIKAEGGAALGPGALAARAAGDAQLAALRVDVDALGRALHDVAAGKPGAEGLRDRLALSEAVALACGPIADAATWREDGPRGVQRVAADSGEVVLVGAWSEVVEVAGALRDALAPGLKEVVQALGASKAAQSIDASAGLALAPPGVPLAHLAARAGEELRRAKGERRTRTGEKRWKRALSWDGVAIGWPDAALAVELALALARAIEAGELPRGVLRRLTAIHALWRRHEAALDAGATREAAAAAKRRWLWAYQLGRAQAGIDGPRVNDGARLLSRLSRLALEDADEGGARRTEQEAAAWLGMVAEIAHRRTRARREERG